MGTPIPESELRIHKSPSVYATSVSDINATRQDDGSLRVTGSIKFATKFSDSFYGNPYYFSIAVEFNGSIQETGHWGGWRGIVSNTFNIDLTFGSKDAGTLIIYSYCHGEVDGGGNPIHSCDKGYPTIEIGRINNIPPGIIVRPPTISNVRCTGKTSSSISMAFDVDWGNEPNTRDPALVLRNSSHTQIAVIRNGTTAGTFTGLSRYTPYYIVGYAGNSAGSVYSNEVLVYTDPEIPKINAPTVSNQNVTSPIQGVASVTVTPGVVTDNGGKAISTIESYIIGGQYGSSLTSIGTGSAAKTLNNLLPNTEYQIITRATNGITEGWSAYTKFTTLGNSPELQDVFASNISNTQATINYQAKYEYNARYKQYQVQWRYPGTSSWTNLTLSTNKITFNTNSTDRIEYRITVTDNWNRSTVSKVMSFVILEDLSELVNTPTATASENTYSITGTWNQKVYNKSSIVLALGKEELQQELEKVGELTKSSTNFSYSTKEYTNKMTDKTFYLFVKPSCSNAFVKTVTVNKQGYPKFINLVKSNNTVLQAPGTTIYQTGSKKQLRPHDIVKLSRKMRYIVLDSKGVKNAINTQEETVDFGLGTFTYTIRHISGTLYMFAMQSMNIKTSNTVRIRNNTIKITVSANSNSNNSFSWWLPNGTYSSTGTPIDTVEYYTYFDIKGKEDQTVTLTFTTNQYAEYDTNDYTKTVTKSFTADASDLINNHLCKIEVYDKNGNNISSGKPIKLYNGNNPLVRNGCDPTTASYNSNNYVYSTNGQPLVLDLGTEYEISRVKVWRRTFNNSYGRCYVHGRNANKELCYIFYDSNINQYIETTSGQTLNVN